MWTETIEIILTAGKVVGAILVIGGAAVALFKNGEWVLVWLLQKIYGRSGGLRIIAKSSKGFCEFNKNADTARLYSEWYATNIMASEMPIRILTVRTNKPLKDFHGSVDPLSESKEKDRDIFNSVGGVYVPPIDTVDFAAKINVPRSSVKVGKEIKAELVFTDNLGNQHRKKIRFEWLPSEQGS